MIKKKESTNDFFHCFASWLSSLQVWCVCFGEAAASHPAAMYWSRRESEWKSLELFSPSSSAFAPVVTRMKNFLLWRLSNCQFTVLEIAWMSIERLRRAPSRRERLQQVTSRWKFNFSLSLFSFYSKKVMIDVALRFIFKCFTQTFLSLSCQSSRSSFRACKKRKTFFVVIFSFFSWMFR